MKILLVAATQAEIDLYCRLSGVTEEHPVVRAGMEISCLITGVGIAAAAFSLGRHLALNAYDLIIHAGIAGAIDRKLSIGQTVFVRSDMFYKLGAEDGENYLSVFDLGLDNPDEYPFKHGKLFHDFPVFGRDFISTVTSVEAITVQTIHGNQTSIETLLQTCPEAQIESQEGASVLFAAKMMQMPCIQIRTISNFVERRNRDAWNLPLAIENLNHFLSNLLKPS